MPTRDDYVAFARQAAQNAGIDPDIFIRQINQESGFDPGAGSSAGAQGIAQIVPAFHPGVNPWDPYASLNYAAQLDAGYLRQYGSWPLALAAYNAGGGAVQQYGGVPPFDETQRYLAAILGGTGGSVPSGTGTPSRSGPAPATSTLVTLGLSAGVLLLLILAVQG